MSARIRTVLRRDQGASAVEYALLVALIAAVIIAAVFLLGRNISRSLSKTGSCISATASAC